MVPLASIILSEPFVLIIASALTKATDSPPDCTVTGTTTSLFALTSVL